jgi:superfamily II DNA or RNA helicase
VSFEKRCSHEVEPSDRDRGKAYFVQRRITIDASDDFGLNATVRGSGRVYDIQLDWLDTETSGILSASCQCPRYQAGFLCKHIWATLMAADQRGHSKKVPGSSDLHVLLPSTGNFAAHEILPVSSPGGQVGGAANASSKTPTTKASWRQQFQSLRRTLSESEHHGQKADREPRRLAHYRLNVLKSLNGDQLVIDLLQQMGRRDTSPLRPLILSEREITEFTDKDDHELLSVLLAVGARELRSNQVMGMERSEPSSGALPPVLIDTLLPRLCATGRFGWLSGLDDDVEEYHSLAWDAEPWHFQIEVERVQNGGELKASIRGVLQRKREKRDLSEALLLLGEGVVVFRDTVSPLEAGDFFPWISLLRRDSEVEVPEWEIDAMLEDFWSMPVLPPMRMPRQWQLDEVRVDPVACISFHTVPSDDLFPGPLRGEVAFDYDGIAVIAEREGHAPRLNHLVDRPHGRLIIRNRERELAALAELGEIGLDLYGDGRKLIYQVQRHVFAQRVRDLLEREWVVKAEGQRLRKAVNPNLQLSVSSNVDWFELDGELQFGDTRASLPALLSAIRRGDLFVRLDDGTHGLLPEEWLSRFSALAATTPADEAEEVVRFLPSQALLLDRLLRGEEVDFDRDYEKIREQLKSFDHIEPAKEPRGFRGELRPYQQEGLGWLKFLKDSGFGGCLADDMGLGKTIQVLALLQMRRARPVAVWERLPSLIVVPRSLIFNWIEEAERFTPKLRLLNYTGAGREEWMSSFHEFDVILTTYGTLRRDIDHLKEQEFDYAILDEAQAIKNASSQAAKSCRMLRAQHRLALTGTPVENHLGELWSIFEFLNPGMLSQNSLKDLIGKPADDEAFKTVSAALTPFIFRRTKKQVLKDLPEKTEQTLYCELEGEQLRLYNELRDHYRVSLKEAIEQVGLQKAKIQVLEALLRLRQAACHPGLIDPDRQFEGSAKIDTVLQQIEEVLDEGHKALVFSQFTSLLSILRYHLDGMGITYEYLDGRTRNRQEKVARFQNDTECRLFLISLKAGGVGLNLTAADYVFILDPWWNPAVEAQAVDRVHRIGQTRPVFAYRLIARGTVEEKILELQGNKKLLADAILSADKSLMSELSTDDLKLLLS